jgi:hypothetical protein
LPVMHKFVDWCMIEWRLQRNPSKASAQLSPLYPIPFFHLFFFPFISCHLQNTNLITKTKHFSY